MNPFDSSVDILEVTLRDGSYLIDFQFTAEDTATIASALQAVGFHWIEVGHGLGLNASCAGKGEAASSDEEYLEATALSLDKAKWGMFFIPGIGRAEDLRLAARYGMSFVRIGTNITELSQGLPFIELAKELGMVVSYNAMKSYAVSPEQFGTYAAQAHSWGVDIVYLVDSAGGMYPDDVEAYLRAAQGQSEVKLGFHGHDNLSLAMANTLRAIECGAVLVDSSLQGIGRSAGNAITEVLLAILRKRELITNIDLKATMDIGKGLIQPLMRQRGMDPMAVTAGYARFHSAFTAKVESYAKRYGLDVRDLIVRLCQEDQAGAPDELLERLSEELASEKMPKVIALPAFTLQKSRETQGDQALTSLLKEIRARAIKAGKYSAVNIVAGLKPQEDVHISRNIQSSPTHIIGSLTAHTTSQLTSVLKALDGTIDVVFLDIDTPHPEHQSFLPVSRMHLKKSLLLTYSDSRVWVDAVADQVIRLLNEDLTAAPVVIAGDHLKSRHLALRIAQRSASITIVDQKELEDSSILNLFRFLSFDPVNSHIHYHRADTPEAQNVLSSARMVIVWPADSPWFGANQASSLSEGAIVLDAGIGAILPEGLEVARTKGSVLIRVNIWPALAGTLASAHESARVFTESLGWGTLNDVTVVAGGAMGRLGDVIVDSIRNPTRVIGIADGRGGVSFKYGQGDAERVRRVNEAIIQHSLKPDIGAD